MNPRFPISCLIISWLIGLSGYVLGAYSNPEYFGRVGSLVVLFGVISEYALLKAELGRLYNLLKGQGAATYGNLGIPDLTPSPWQQKQALMSHITIVVGTVIWGFGDLWFK